MTRATRLLIARHGNTFGPNDIVRRVGVTDLPLVESGVYQGERLGAYLKAQQWIPDHIFTSCLQRTIQTATAAQQTMHIKISMEPLDIFNEIDYGVDENQPEKEVVARLGEAALAAWEKEAIVPDGWRVDPAVIIKNWFEFAKMLLQQYEGRTVLVVTSNGIARFLPYLTGNFSEFCDTYGIKLATGAVGLFEYEQHGLIWRCKQWNVKP